jgi:hypothetical protein
MKTALLPLPEQRKTSLCKNASSASNPKVVLEEWTSGDEHSPIYWDFAGSPHGELLIASTSKGIAFVARTGEAAGINDAIETFKKRFPNNLLLQERTAWHEVALQRIKGWSRSLPVHLHLRGKSQQFLEFCFGKNDHHAQLKPCTLF